jgi:hypothetical protein
MCPTKDVLGLFQPIVIFKRITFVTFLKLHESFRLPSNAKEQQEM